jgi:hypothetical protein
LNKTYLELLSRSIDLTGFLHKFRTRETSSLGEFLDDTAHLLESGVEFSLGTSFRGTLGRSSF